jgi:predicted exporter
MVAVMIVTLVNNGRQFDANILSTLPDISNPVLAEADHYFSNQLSGKLVFSFQGNNAEQAYDTLVDYIEQQASLQIESNAAFSVSTLAALYHDHKSAVMSDQSLGALQSSQASLAAFQYQLTQSASPFVSATIDADPSLNLAAFLTHNSLSLSPLSMENGRLVLPQSQPRILFLFARTNDELAPIDALTHQLKSLQLSYPSTQIRYSGAPFHNAENTQIAKFETSFFSTLSLVGLALLVWIAFRSMWPLLFTQLGILVAVIWGTFALTLLFQKIHILSFLFGITLIGIAIDYALHVMAHQGCSTKHQSALYKTLTLGFITTSLGYLGFVISSIELLTQVATFVIVGLMGAWSFALWALPPLNKKVNLQLGQQVVTHSKGISRLAIIGAHYFYPIILFISLVTLSAFIIRPPTLSSNVSELSASSATLVANEASHYTSLNNGDIRYLVAAENLEDLLQKEEKLRGQITKLAPQASIQSISQWLPSLSQQQQNHATYMKAQNAGVFTRINSLLTKNVDFSQWQPLSLAELQASPLSDFVNLHLYHSGSLWVSWLGVSGLSLDKQNDLQNQNANSVNRYAKVELLNQSMAQFGQQIMIMASIAVAIVIILIAISETIQAALKAALVLINVVLLAIWSSALILGSINVFNLLAIMLIIALAADYLLFYCRQGLEATTIFAITLSALSSALVFGVLIFSQTPALRSCGLTVTLGLILIYCFAPMTVRKKE